MIGMISKIRSSGAVIAFAAILTASGCSDAKAEEVSPDTSSASVSSGDVSEEAKTGAQNAFSFMDTKVCIPFKISDLKNVRVDEEICFETEDNGLFSQLWYGDYRIGNVILEDCSVDEKHKDEKNVVYLKISPDIMFDDFEFEYKGLTIGSTKEELINTLGGPASEDRLTYMTDDKTKIEFKLSDNKIYRVTISSYDLDDG